MALKATAIVIPLEMKLLIVGDGLFSKRRGMVTHLPGAVSYIGYFTPCAGNKPKPQCGGNILIRAGSFPGPFSEATRLVLP